MQPLAVDHPASATAIRQALAQGEKPLWLPPPVAAYIAARGLYKA